MSATCRLVSRRLPSLVDGEMSARSQRHIDRCLRCQAEAVRYRTLSRQLAAMRTQLSPAPPALMSGVMDSLYPGAEVDAYGNEGPVVKAAAAAAGLAALAGASAYAVTRIRRARAA